MDPDSLTAMERSQTLTDDQREASPSLSNPEVGIYEDIGAPIEPKIHELKIAQQFIEHLENVTLDNSKIDDWVRERLQHPLTTTVDDMLDPILRLSIDIYLAVSNASQATYDSVRDSLIRFNPDKPILFYDAVKRRITKISGVAPFRKTCVSTHASHSLDLSANLTHVLSVQSLAMTHRTVERTRKLAAGNSTLYQSAPNCKRSGAHRRVPEACGIVPNVLNK